jgi:hypothetical protein
VKESEKRDLLLFLDLFGGLESLAFDFGERPDLVVTTPEGRLGIEHTSLLIEVPNWPSGRQMKAQERLQFQIAQRAFELFRSQVSLPLYLTVQFDEPYEYETRDVPIVATELCRAVLQSLTLTQPALAQGHDVRVESWQFRHRGLAFPSRVSSFHYSVVSPIAELWGPADAYVVPHITLTDLESRIAKKEPLLDAYLKRCDKCWLLIATDAGLRSSHFNAASEELIHHSYVTRFENLFLMHATHRTLTSLRAITGHETH